MRHRTAFTLFELLLVLGLMGILAGIATPAIQGWVARAQIDQASSAIVQMTNEAKRRAIDEGAPWSIKYAKRESKLQLLSSTSNSGARATSQTSAATSKLDEQQLDESVSLRFSDTNTKADIKSIKVSPLGTISPARIEVFRHGKLVDSFVTNRLTGDVRRTRSSH